MDKFLQELSLLNFGSNDNKPTPIICNCINIGYRDIEYNKSLESFMSNKNTDIMIHGDLNFDLDVVFNVTLTSDTKIEGMLKCNKFTSLLTNSSNVNWNNIHAFNLVVNNNDIETIINNGIVMESVRILSLSKKINIEILKKLFPNCILINFSIYEFRLPKRKISDIINYYINANYIFINNDTDDCYANEYMYDLILSKNFNFTRSINLFSEDDRNKIYANIEDVFGTKTEMYKNANSA